MSGMFLFREFDSIDPEENIKDEDSDEEFGPVINTTTISSPKMGRGSSSSSSKKKSSKSMSPKIVAVNSPLLKTPSSLRQSSSHDVISKSNPLSSSKSSPLSRSASNHKTSSMLIPEPVKKEPQASSAPATPEMNLLKPRNTPSLVPVMLPSRSRSLAPGDEASSAALRARLIDEPKEVLPPTRRKSVSVSTFPKPKDIPGLSLSSTPPSGSPVLQPKSILKKSSKSMDITSPVSVRRESALPTHQSTTLLLDKPQRRLSKSEAMASKPVSELNVSTNSLLSLMNLGDDKRARKEEERRKLETTQNAFRARYEKTFGRERSIQLFGE